MITVKAGLLLGMAHCGGLGPGVCLDHRVPLWPDRGSYRAATASASGLSGRDAQGRLLVGLGALAAYRHRVARPVSTVGFVQPDVDVIDYLIEAGEVHLLCPRDLVLPVCLGVPAEGVKFIAKVADQLLGNAGCAEV